MLGCPGGVRPCVVNGGLKTFVRHLLVCESWEPRPFRCYLVALLLRIVVVLPLLQSVLVWERAPPEVLGHLWCVVPLVCLGSPCVGWSQMSL